MKLVKFLLSMSIVWVLTIQSRCKKEQDPCENQAQFKADFTIGEMVQDSFVPTDTLLNVNFQVAVKANDKYQSFKWKIGDEPRDFANQQTVKLNFPADLAGRTFKITLFAKGVTNPDCVPLPNDDGLDTIIKQFTIGCNANFQECKSATRSIKQAYLGKWRGSLDDAPNHEFDIQIADFGADPNVSDDTLFYNLRLYNLPEGCGGPQTFNAVTACGGKTISPFFYANEISEFGYNGFYISDAFGIGCCPPIKMYGQVVKSPQNLLIIYLTHKKDGKKQKFTGRRL